MSRYRDSLNRYKGVVETLKRQRKDRQKALEETAEYVKNLHEARDIANAVMQATQIEIKEFIEEVVSLCLKTVLGERYGFLVEYEIKRNKSEAPLFVFKDGEKYDPEGECGGGVLNVAALGLRMAMWSLANPKLEPILALDEPEVGLSKDRLDRLAQIFRKLAETFLIQLLYVSHDPALAEEADITFEVTQEKGVSSVAVV